MVEVKLGQQSVDLPFTLRVPGVTEERFDELVDPDTRAELIDGVMIVHSPAALAHEAVGGFLRGLLGFFGDAKGLGKALGPDSIVHLATCRKFAPDVYFLLQERVPTPLPKEFEGAPDFVIEILSPSNRDDDLEDKRPAYREAGVGEIWFVDPENRQVLIDRKRKRRYVEEVVTSGRAASEVVAGFWVDASWLWDEPLPNRMACLQEILSGS